MPVFPVSESLPQETPHRKTSKRPWVRRPRADRSIHPASIPRPRAITRAYYCNLDEPAPNSAKKIDAFCARIVRNRRGTGPADAARRLFSRRRHGGRRISPVAGRTFRTSAELSTQSGVVPRDTEGRLTGRRVRTYRPTPGRSAELAWHLHTLPPIEEGTRHATERLEQCGQRYHPRPGRSRRVETGGAERSAAP